MIFELVSVLIASIIGFGIYYSVSIYKLIKKYKTIPGYEYNGIIEYFVGDLKKINRLESRGKIFSDLYLEEMFDLKSKTVKLRLLNQIMIFTCDPRIIKTLLIEKNFKKDASYEVLAYPGNERYKHVLINFNLRNSTIYYVIIENRFMGNGLLTDVNYERWKHRRGLFNHAFHKQYLESFIKKFNLKGNKLVNHLKELSKTEKEPIRLLQKFNQIALDIIASVAFSIDVDSLADSNNFLIKCVNESLAGAILYFFDPFMNYQLHKWPAIMSHRRVIRKLRDFGRKQIESRIQAIKNGEELPNDMLTTILKAHEKENFFIEDMVDDFITFFIAGQETTSGALSLIFLELGRNPHILEKLRNEIDEQIGIKEEIEFEDLSKLKYTSCVFREALRLYPPVPELSRINEEEIRVDDIIIPKDSWVFVSPYACGRNADFFPDPYKFDPDRFMSHDTVSIQNYTFFPFSLGPRNCIGQNFAQIETKMLTAKIIQNFNFELDKNQSFALDQSTTIKPKDGLKCFLTPR